MGAIRGLISSVAQAAGRFDEERCGGTRWLGHPAFVRSIQHVKQRHAFDRSRGAIASEVCDHDEAKKSPRAWSRKACPRTRSGGGVRFSDEDHAPRKREAKRRKTHAIQCPHRSSRRGGVWKRSIADKLARSAQLICLRGPLAFRRSAAALAPASERQDSAQAALHAKHDAKALPPLRIALKQGTLRAGRNAGGA